MITTDAPGIADIADGLTATVEAAAVVSEAAVVVYKPLVVPSAFRPVST